MNKPTNKLIPELRFPEFLNEGEWEKKKLGETAENLDSKRVPITSNQREKGNIPYYGASGIIDYVKEYIYDENLLCISEDGANLIDRNYPIAFSISGKTWVNNHAHVLKFENTSTQLLVEKYINSINLEDFLTGMAQPKLNRGKLDIIPIPLPQDPKEQQKIASCLSSLDEVIAAHNQKLEALKDHKNGLMQNLFPQEDETVPKYRFPEFENDGEWVEDILLNLAVNGFSNGVFNDPKKVGSGYRLINVINMYTESPINENDLTFLELAKSEFVKNKVEFGDIFFTRSSLVPEGIAKSNIYLGSFDNITYDGHLIRMRPLQELIKPIYLHYLLKTENVRRQMIAKGKTATMTTIGQSDVAGVVVSYSNNPKEQQKIASCLSSLDALIAAQTEKIEQLKLHKKGLMQGLFPIVN